MRKPFRAIYRLIRGTKMIDFNPMWMYHLGQCLGQLELVLRPGVPVGDIYRELISAHGACTGILYNPQHVLFPETRDDLTGLFDAINAVAPSDARLKHQMHVITTDVSVESAPS